MSTDAVSGALAKMLPEIINHVTPSGQVPASADLGANLGSLMKQFGL
jgi:uncharacterized protein YidB (DUF937 family)